MLTIDDLTVRYRTLGGEIEALTSVSLFAEKGSTLALVGESGSGKSTIALAAMGLLPAEAKVTSGRVLLARDDILAQADRNRARMRERDPERRRTLLRDLQAITQDRDKLRAYLRRSSMIDGLARAAALV